MRSVVRALEQVGGSQIAFDRLSRLAALGATHARMSHYSTARKLFAKALFEGRQSAKPEAIIATCIDIGHLYYLQADYRLAERWFHHASERLPHHAALTSIVVHTNLAATKYRLYRDDEARAITARIRLVADQAHENPFLRDAEPVLAWHSHVIRDLETATSRTELMQVLEDFDRVRRDRWWF
jgi:hypothetical protein